MRDDLIRRYAPAAYELRETGTTAVLEGYASTFNQPYDMGYFREEVKPGAFTRSLKNGADVRFLVDHEGQPLARTKSGTLELSEDTTGLHQRATLDLANPVAQGVVSAVRRGDLDAMSFAFRVVKGGDNWSDDLSHRSLTELNIHDGDVSVVTQPANPGTSIGVRSRQHAAVEYILAVMTEHTRAGKTISAATASKLQAALDALVAADQAIDEADDAIDAATAAVSDALGVEPPADADDDTPTSAPEPGRSAANALRLAKRAALKAAS